MPNSVNENNIAPLIERLSLAVGVAGYAGPHAVQNVVAAELAPLVDRVETDRLGSVVGVKPGDQPDSDAGPRRKIMLAAHLDEIGAVVTHLDNGFVRFAFVGGLDSRVLMGQEVVVHGRRDLPGIIGSIPPHFLPPGRRTGKVEKKELLVDVGLSPAELAKQVQIGDRISFAARPMRMQNGRLTAKALDNRASVAAMLVCLQELRQMRHHWDVVAVATAQEETGGYLGATTQTFALQPDAALALDVTFSDVDEVETKLDNGPVLALGPSNHPVLRQWLVDTCGALEMSYQSEVITSGAGTDAFAIEISRTGVPTVLVSVPIRHMHTPVEMLSLKDVTRTGRLLAHLIAGLDEDSAAQLVPQT